VHDRAPVWHGFVGVQAAPATHAVHTPALQTCCDPQGVPSDTGATAVHAGAPVEQSVLPLTQLPCEGVQGWLATHEMHAPEALQTWSLPHDEPAARAVEVGVHATPAEQLTTPSRQGALVGTQSAPAAHEVHTPAAVQIDPVPHGNPASWSPICTQTGCPDEHSSA
jgi:hypothetical protein